jgi:hypothetical protein
MRTALRFGLVCAGVALFAGSAHAAGVPESRVGAVLYMAGLICCAFWTFVVVPVTVLVNAALGIAWIRRRIRGERPTNLVQQSLKQQTTYREYAAKWIDEGGNIPPGFLPRVEQREAEIAAKMQPGDELWEYEYGDWNAFTGVSGLAIVRGGVVVKSWVEWEVVSHTRHLAAASSFTVSPRPALALGDIFPPSMPGPPVNTSRSHDT